MAALGRKRSGQVLTVALIDNAGVAIALPGWLFLQEALTRAKLTGSGFIVVGLPVIARG